jgi:hypothetical protein
MIPFVGVRKGSFAKSSEFGKDRVGAGIRIDGMGCWGNRCGRLDNSTLDRRIGSFRVARNQLDARAGMVA